MGKAATFIAYQHGKIVTGAKAIDVASAREIVECDDARMGCSNLGAGDLGEGALRPFLILDVWIQPFGVAETARSAEHRRGMRHDERVCGIFDPVPNEHDVRRDFHRPPAFTMERCFSTKRFANASWSRVLAVRTERFPL